MESIVVLSHDKGVPLRKHGGTDFYQRIAIVAEHFDYVSIICREKGRRKGVHIQTDPEISNVRLIRISGDSISTQVLTSVMIQRLNPVLVVADTLSDTNIALAHLILTRVNLVSFIRGFDRSIAARIVEERFGNLLYWIANHILFLRDLFVFRRSSAIVTVTDGLADYARGFLNKKSQQKVVLIPRSLQYCKTIPADSTDRTNKMIEKIRTDREPRTIAISCVGNLVKTKRFDVAIMSLVWLKGNLHPAVLLMAGNGPEETALRNLACSCGIEDSVVFLGKIPRHDVLALNQACDLMLSTSQSEGSARAVREAMAVGCPVVCFRFHGAQKLGLEKASLLVNEMDPILFAKAIMRVIKEPDLSRKLVESGYKLAEQYYAWSDLERGERILDILKTFRRSS